MSSFPANACGTQSTLSTIDGAVRAQRCLAKTLRGGLAAALLALTAQPVLALATFTETFEDESNAATTFGEAPGPDFTVNGDLMVELFAGLGSGGSDYWLGTGFGGAGNGSGGSSGNVGTMTVDSGFSFVINSFDAWTGQSNGDSFFAGDIKFIGTKLDSTMVEHTLTIATANDTDFVTGLNFSGSALDGMALTSLSFELVTGAPLDYLALDNINYTADQIQTPPPPNGNVPAPSTLMLFALGLLAATRRAKAA